MLLKYQLKLLLQSAVQHETLRDESIEILSTSRHYQRDNMTYFQHPTFRIYTKEGGPEDNHHWKEIKTQRKTKSEQKIRSSKPDVVSYDLISRGEIDAAFSHVQRSNVQMQKK